MSEEVEVVEQQDNSSTPIDNSGYGVMPTFLQTMKNQSEMVKLLKVSDYLDEFESRLKGIYFDKYKNKYVQRGEQLVNRDGTDMLMSIILSHCNNIITMTVFSETTINHAKYKAMMSVLRFIRYNHKRFGIRKENAYLIMNQAEILIMGCLHRTREGGGNDKSFLTTVERVLETRNTITGGGMGMAGGGIPRRGGGGGWLNKFVAGIRGADE